MVRQLRPFIVTSWHGHRNDENIPAAISEVWRAKHRPQPGPPPLRPPHSNVDLAILDFDGDLIHSFDAFPPRDVPHDRLGDYTLGHIWFAASILDLDEGGKDHPLTLPGLDGRRGIRVLVSLKDDRMRAYQAPVAEAVPLDDADWKLLAWPGEKRTVQAGDLSSWLSQVYPPGVMERTDPITKKVYEVAEVRGALTLSPAGGDQDHRYAVLRGELEFEDEGEDAFTYRGTLNVVLRYTNEAPAARSVHGVFEGIYPREDRRHGRTREIPLQAVFESLPE